MRTSEKVTEPNDPRRCQWSTSQGQCWNVVAEGSDYCREHYGKSNAEQVALDSYLLAKAEDRCRLASISNELEPVKELRDSIALLHMLIERRFNTIHNDMDLIQACPALNVMLQNMDRLVNSCHKLEKNLGQLLAKQALLALSKRIVEILIEELEEVPNYEEIIDRISEKMVVAIQKTDNRELTDETR